MRLGRTPKYCVANLNPVQLRRLGRAFTEFKSRLVFERSTQSHDGLGENAQILNGLIQVKSDLCQSIFDNKDTIFS